MDFETWFKTKPDQRFQDGYTKAGAKEAWYHQRAIIGEIKDLMKDLEVRCYCQKPDHQCRNCEILTELKELTK